MDNLYIYVVSLGCDKNRIDTEHMLGILAGSNAAVVDAPEDADVIIVNTCGFIDEAKRESIDVILEMAKYKHGGSPALIVTGCLAQRYASELSEELPEVDAFLGVNAYSNLLDAIRIVLEGKRYVCCDRLDGDIEGRVLTTPSHMAYVRIADGCSNSCSYCAIPRIRGPLKSRPLSSVLKEIEDLRAGGVCEAVLVAQDTTRYGEDLGKRDLPRLIDEAADIMKGGWLRVMYCYPEGITDELVNVMRKHDNVCRYLDIPMQHFSDPVLKAMHRRHTRAESVALTKSLHEKGFVLRTSLIVGFPGETQSDFDILLDSIREIRFERLGVFRYSAEEGTAAAKMSSQIEDDVKQARYEKVMAVQAGISSAYNEALVGQTVRVMIDGADDTGLVAGRTMGQAPSVDGVTYISAKKDLTPGTFHDVLITEANEYDLLGELK
jgi:ribosomal protein S12 methylthiotransferase